MTEDNFRNILGLVAMIIGGLSLFISSLTNLRSAGFKDHELSELEKKAGSPLFARVLKGIMGFLMLSFSVTYFIEPSETVESFLLIVLAIFVILVITMVALPYLSEGGIKAVGAAFVFYYLPFALILVGNWYISIGMFIALTALVLIGILVYGVINGDIALG